MTSSGAGQCRVERNGSRLSLVGPGLEYVLDLSDGPRPVAFCDRRSDRMLETSGGSELGAWVDRADERIWITGWRGTTSVIGDADPDDDPGLAAGHHEIRFDDRDWPGMHSPSHFWYEHGPRTRWARTHVFIPDRIQDRSLTLVLGGHGLFDYDWTRVFLNGVEVATRVVSGRWRAPAHISLGPGSVAHDLVRYGRDNVVALQLRGYVSRSPALETADPGGTRLMPMRTQWPAQFDQFLVVGELDEELRFGVEGVADVVEGGEGRASLAVVSSDGTVSGHVCYRWDATAAAVERQVALWVLREHTTLMRVDLLDVNAPGVQISDGEQGFPVYLDDAFYATVAHPAGWATGGGAHVRLTQYPGRELRPGETWTSMPSLVGAGGLEGARAAFVEHLGTRMRRRVRGRDVPLSIGTAFGSWDYDPETASGPFAEVISQEPDESIILDNLANLRVDRNDGWRPDWFVLDFWVDQGADFEQPDRRRFARGFGPIRDAAAAAGARFGVWLDSSMAAWSLGENPLVSGCLTHDAGYGSERPTLCWASEPYRSLATNGYLHLVEHESVGLMKFDNLQSICCRTDHDHLPGIWSTEAIMSSVVAALRAIDRAAPETLLMLYWGQRSPWWLLDADTLFEPGFWIEAAHPASSPTLYVRDSVIQGLDQAQRFCQEVPVLAKDSLGVWLSSWKWNSSIGAERWREALVMDMCRGSLLTQIWSDRTWMDAAERRDLGRLDGLVRAHPGAFAASRPIGGDPWRDEPYGYVCADGERAFVALFNATWLDASLPMLLDARWNLPEADAWRIVRHHPGPVELSATDPIRAGIRYHLRPFELVLLEAWPFDGDGRPTDVAPFPGPFTEASCPLSVDMRADPSATALPLAAEHAPRVAPSGPTRPGSSVMPPKRSWHVSTTLPASASGGTAVVWLKVIDGGQPHPLDDAGSFFAAEASLDGRAVASEPVVRARTYSVPWQAWRVRVDPAPETRVLELCVTVALSDDLTMEPGGAFVPG